MKNNAFAFMDREFVRKFGVIALPAMLVNLINFGVKAVDTLMLGMVGEIQLSGAALANQLSFMFMILGGAGIAGGCAVMTAQYWGAGEKERVRDIFGFMFRVMALLNIVFAAIAFFAPHWVLGILTTDQEVIAEGVKYLRIISVGYLFWGFSNAATMVLRSVGVIKVPVVALSVSLSFSTLLNYVLIFGNFGFPEMGISGAATATVIARIIEFFILMVYLFKYEKNLLFRLHNLGRRGKGVAKAFMKYSLPVVMNETFWATGFFTLNIIIGRIGREFVAANAIGSLFIQFTGMIIFSFAGATAVVVGNTIGEGRYDRAKRIANGMLIISFIIGIACFVIIQAIRIPFINIYDLSDAARVYALQLTNVISVNIIFISVSVISLFGTLRGGGDAKFVMVTDIVFMWVIGIPLGAIAGLWLGWPVWVVFIILRSDEFFKTIIVLWRVPRGRWLRDLTKG